MKIARLLVVGVAVAAGGTALILMNRSKPVEVKAVVAAHVVVPDHILTMTRDVPLGTILEPNDMAWTPWPAAAITATMVVEKKDPQGITQNVGAIARESFYKGDPVNPEKLVKGATGFMSALLPSGMRAVAINIEGSGATSAGGFILPNDRVDVLRTYNDATATRINGIPTYGVQTVLTNVRVLAIGQNIKDQKGKPTVVGSNATLELTPEQTETISLAQKTGSLSLALRSITDSNQAKNGPGTDAPQSNQGFTVVRYGIAQDAGLN
ncbi:MAG: Flp pilus assembly protein CpaB [Hyphomicrobiales bacterium]|nr:Flp pilus assembly protein CpaB [Hyphomicrobiales bacterium]